MEVLKNAIIWYSLKPVCRIKHIYMHGNYPAVSIYDKKIHIHRLIKMYELKSDIQDGLFVHHINENKMDARKSNLCLVPVSEHQSIHNKGKTLSKEHKEKISLANHKRKGIKIKKRIEMPRLMEYVKRGLSINKISQIYGCGWDAVKARIKEHENKELLK